MAKHKGMNRKPRVFRIMVNKTSRRSQEETSEILKTAMLLEESIYTTYKNYGMK
jgi:hypothetical protein